MVLLYMNIEVYIDRLIRCKFIFKICIFWIDDLWKIVNKINSVGILFKYLINVDVFL